MQKREKILAGGLAAVLVLWLGLPMLENTFLKPLKELDARKQLLQTEIDRVFDQQIALARKDSQMKEWRGRSLPPDPLDSQRLYQEWLTNLAQLSGFEQMKVTLDRRVAVGETLVTIPVTLEAKAKLQELALFLERFESVDLLHRVSRCDVVSPSSAGDPELGITLTAEGLSLQSAMDRPRLFAQTELFEPITRDDQQFTVVSNRGFPEQAPFRIRINNEFLNVTDIQGNVWRVQRGVEKTFAEDHAGAAAVEEFPVRETGAPDERAIAGMTGRNPFTKPAAPIETNPHLASTTPPPAIRGQTWNWKLEVADWNAAYGSPNFELLAAPAGVELDERTGALRWSVGRQAELGEQALQVLVWGTNGRNAGFTPSVKLRVRDPNQRPRIEQPGPLRFFLGRESKKQIKATDPDGEDDQLTFALQEGPEGMTIEPRTGEIRWTPPESLAPQELSIRVEVKDADELAETTTATLPVSLEEDSARFAYLTGSVQRTSGEREAWIYDRATNRTTVVRTGDRVRIADFDLEVESIGPTFILVRREGQLHRLDFEQSLVQMTPIPEPAGEAAPATSPEAEAAGAAAPAPASDGAAEPGP